MLVFITVAIGAVYIYWFFGGSFKSKPKQEKPQKKEKQYPGVWVRINKRTIKKLSDGGYIYELEDMKMVCEECYQEVKLSQVVNLRTRVYHDPYGKYGVCPICNTANRIVMPRIETIEHALKRNY